MLRALDTGDKLEPRDKIRASAARVGLGVPNVSGLCSTLVMHNCMRLPSYYLAFGINFYSVFQRRSNCKNQCSLDLKRNHIEAAVSGASDLNDDSDHSLFNGSFVNQLSPSFDF